MRYWLWVSVSSVCCVNDAGSSEIQLQFCDISANQIVPCPSRCSRSCCCDVTGSSWLCRSGAGWQWKCQVHEAFTWGMVQRVLLCLLFEMCVISVRAITSWFYSTLTCCCLSRFLCMISSLQWKCQVHEAFTWGMVQRVLLYLLSEMCMISVRAITSWFYSSLTCCCLSRLLCMISSLQVNLILIF